MTRDEKRAFFALVAYGVHSKYQKRIRALLKRDFQIKTSFVYEYFLDEPIAKDAIPPSASIFEPFLLRLLNESLFIPEMPKTFPNSYEDIKRVPNTYESMTAFWNSQPKGATIDNFLQDTFIGKEVFKLWASDKDTNLLPDHGWLKKETEKSIVFGTFSYLISYLQSDYLRDIVTQVKDPGSLTGILKEYACAVLPWLHCPNPDKESLDIGVVSITTQKLFFGYVLIYYSTLKSGGNIFIDIGGNESEVSREVKTFVAETYASILALFENYWDESKLDEEIDAHHPADRIKLSAENYLFLREGLQDSNDGIESVLSSLWHSRKEFLEDPPCGFDTKDLNETIKQTLLFSKYLITSPTIVGELRNMMVPRNLSKKKTKEYLSCALVIGGPGSGKDDIARIIHLFFPEYRFGPVYSINMAALKPNYLAVPLISGFNGQISVKTPGSDVDYEADIKGIFARIWSEFEEKYPDDASRANARERGLMPVIILDELNSLDIDAQGSLLRILQNAKLLPLGATKEDQVNFLIVGVINEPADALTMEEPLRRLLVDKDVFGGILGRGLYEQFRKIRRLRDDLYYRLVRDGKFKLLDLNERREEVPILLSFFLKKELDNSIEVGWDRIWFDFDIFEELMDQSISWTGNFRQLQSLAKRVSNGVIQDSQNRDAKDKIKSGDPLPYIHVSVEHIRDVMEEFFKKQI